MNRPLLTLRTFWADASRKKNGFYRPAVGNGSRFFHDEGQSRFGCFGRGAHGEGRINHIFNDSRRKVQAEIMVEAEERGLQKVGHFCQDVNQLLNQFKQVRKMMKEMSSPGGQKKMMRMFSPKKEILLGFRLAY
ncbi:MAG: hypothetical protein CM1200mP3_08400 [Chloroflexota bacterium]|nr:MAG: hypothetical protein CM1200mP3_08400 [Chloroflexota bacterium]